MKLMEEHSPIVGGSEKKRDFLIGDRSTIVDLLRWIK